MEAKCCDGSGWYLFRVPTHHPLFGKPQKCECGAADRVRAEQALGKLECELGSMSACTFGTFDVDRQLVAVTWRNQALSPQAQKAALLAALAACQSYAAAPAGWLYLHGAYGAGKSHLAAAIAHEIASRGVMVRNQSVPTLLDAIKSGFKDDTADRVLDDLIGCGLLVLDDLGAEHLTGWAEDRLFRILNERLQHERHTVITSNLHPDDLPGRLASRIAGAGRNVWLPLSDYRRLPK